LAISKVEAFAHLSAADVEELGSDLDAIRAEIEGSLGARDATYIRRTIVAQRALEVASRLMIHRSRARRTWLLGVMTLAAAKSIENMEIGHNVGHGQWDWMNDPEIHSNTWEWDMAGLSSQWRYSHNYTHHVHNNIVGMDDDIGFGVLRVTRDQEWKPDYLLAPIRNLLLAAAFEWGIALHGLHSSRDRALVIGGSKGGRELAGKIARQLSKDYLLWPALSGRRFRRALAANAAANVLRNVWAYLVIFCGHFPDGAQKFDPVVLETETKGQWYLRQMLGSANFDAGPVMGFMSGHLCYQIEHHLFPDLPSNRLAEIAARVRRLCDVYDLPYTTGPLLRQYLLAFRTIHKLSLPDRFLTATADDAVETASERMFEGQPTAIDVGTSEEGSRRGLMTALRERQRTGATVSRHSG
jgi:NADPH-dependent stearoyl-CoA 9-desaturase